MKRKEFSKQKFRSMLLTGTFTMAALYIMLLADSLIAGHFLGEDGVAAINLITPLTGIITFLSCIISMGSSIIYSRYIGEADKERADRIYGQGLIISVGLAVISAILLFFGRDLYFDLTGAAGDSYELAIDYYRLLPLNAILTVMIQYLSNMVYADGDELINNISYGMQIGGNVVLSIFLCAKIGM